MGLAGTAAAYDNRPPRAELRFGSLLQEGRLERYDWSTKTEDVCCVSSVTVANVRYPRPGFPVGPGPFRAALRLSRPDRPGLRVTAREGRGLDGRELGRARRVRFTMRPRRAGDEIIGWAARLRSTVEQDLYLRITGSWDDRHGCLGTQRATWLFDVSAD